MALVSLAVLARVIAGGGLALPRVGGAAAALVAPLAIFAWYATGPGAAGLGGAVGHADCHPRPARAPAAGGS